MKTRYVLCSGLFILLTLAFCVWTASAASLGYITTPGYAFRPDLVFNDTSFSYASGGALVGWSGARGYTCFYAPVSLPDGAIIKSLEARVLDQNILNRFPDDRVNVYLIRNDYSNPNNSAPEGTYLIEARTASSSPQVQYPQGTAIDSTPVDNLNYTYILTTCLNQDQRVWKVKVEFEKPQVSSFLPLVSDTN